ncbi:MAG TPA: tRNA uracil 4-sulfurtransferase ThiI [Streptosporangiaceae bacterium]
MSASSLTVPPVITAGPAMHEPCVLLKLGEVVLKGRNRQRFERLLHDNIRRSVQDLGVGIRVWQREGVIVVRTSPGRPAGPAGRGSAGGGPAGGGGPGGPAAASLAPAAAADLIAERMRLVMGLARVCRAVRVDKDADAATAAALELTAGHSGTFAVRARRRDKRFPVTSARLAADIGDRIRREHGLTVSLGQPGITVHVEVDQREIFVYTDGLPGQGGLPVGMSGRALVLVSGGIDSPVAAYRMMRRGLRCGYLHFSGMPLTGPESVYKAYALVRQLDRFQGDSRLFVAAFGSAQRRLASSGAGRLQIMAQRRLMLKTGAVLARRLGATALITGDSLGQVSSQTLVNLTALDDAVALPILRPLIGLDKIEIMAQARTIATLAISELRDEDCCSRLAPRQAETRARISDLRRIEARIDADGLAEELAATAREHTPAWP